ncbi:MAG: hypothetical protein M3N43_02300, partial [Actinomycetota bacterium]|nr:hypothetical protein [Actinomycetota bacterium]
NEGGDLLASGNLIVDQGGTLVALGVDGPGDFDIDGNVVIDGASTTGLLVDGRLTVGGNFTQLATLSAESFAPDANFITMVKFGGIHNVTFATPGPAGSGSHFGGLELTGAAGLVLQTNNDLWVEGVLVDTAFGSATILNSAAALRTLTARDVNVQDITFDHMQLQLQKSGLPAAGANPMDNVTFTNFLTTEDQFLVDLPGQSGVFVWSNFVFTQLDTGGGDTGRYVVATDNDGGIPDVLSILIGTNQRVAGELGYYVGLNGAIVHTFSP